MSTTLPQPLKQIYDQLVDLPFDHQPTDFPFVKRLAVENNWTMAFAEQVLEEYRRFLLLASLNTQVVSPSDAVDQAWHLHLTYTRSYWQDLCDHVLRRPLHHEPMSGWGQDKQRFMQQYADTLAYYQTVFKEAPPATIWPSVKKRFANMPDYRRVNMALYQLHPYQSASGFIRGLFLLVFGIFFVELAFGATIAIIVGTVFGIIFASSSSGITPLYPASKTSGGGGADGIGSGACGAGGCGSGGCGGGGCGGGGCGGS